MKTRLILALIFISSIYSCNISRSINKQTLETQDYTVTLKSKNTGNESSITGQLKDMSNSEPIGFATVALIKNGQVVTTGITDLEGNFQLKKINIGQYIFEVKAVGYEAVKMPVKIESGTTIRMDVKTKPIPMKVLKPVIYLYPAHKTEISVRLNYQGNLTHTYPAYPQNGWKVTAEPNGTLWDQNGLEYYALFWEGKPKSQPVPMDGFVIPGHETAAFLEEKLAYLGLNRREANEFIMFWLPQMENNAYNLIHFAGKVYEEQAELIITPKPETTIRVMMLTKGLNSKIDYPLQDLSSLKKIRKGFTAVEWGGSVINFPDL